jgi:hypothetical protein
MSSIIRKQAPPLQPSHSGKSSKTGFHLQEKKKTLHYALLRYNMQHTFSRIQRYFTAALKCNLSLIQENIFSS